MCLNWHWTSDKTHAGQSLTYKWLVDGHIQLTKC